MWLRGFSSYYQGFNLSSYGEVSYGEFLCFTISGLRSPGLYAVYGASDSLDYFGQDSSEQRTQDLDVTMAAAPANDVPEAAAGNPPDFHPLQGMLEMVAFKRRMVGFESISWVEAVHAKLEDVGIS